MKPTLLRLFILLSFLSLRVISEAQFNCDPSVQNNSIDASSAAFNQVNYSFSMNNTGAGYQCCGQNQSYTCEQFSITTNNASIAFRVSSPNLTGNISINVNDCSTPIALDSFFCITGGGIVNVSICSDSVGRFDLIF